MATTAAILEIAVRADTMRAQAGLRQIDQKTSQTAASARKLTEAQTRQGSAFRSSTQQMGRYGTVASQTKTKQDQLTRGATSLGGSLKTMAKGAVAAAAGFVGISQAKAAVDTTTDLAKATKTLNANLGLSLKLAGGFAAEARVRGIDTNKLTITTKSYANAVEAASDATTSQADAFRSLGISTKELKKLNPDQLLFAIADGAEKLGDGTERTKALGQIFGRSFGPLRPLFSGGADALRDFIKANTEAGGNLGAKGGGLDKIQDLIDAQRQAKRETQGLQVAFGTELAPALTKVLGVFGDIIKGKFLQWVINAAKNVAAFTKMVFENSAAGQLIVKYLVKGAQFLFNFGKAAITAGKWVGNAFNNIKDAVGNAIQWIKNAWGNLKDFLVSPFEAAVGKIRGFINDIIGIINTVLGPIGVHIGEVGGGGGGTHPKSATPPHSKPAKQKQRGGGIGGSGSGDKVPAMLEPGEFVLNRKAVQRVGLEKLNQINKAIPRFQKGGAVQALALGGVVDSVGGALGKLPGTGGIPDWLKPAGEFVLDKVGGFIKKKIASGIGSLGSLFGGGGAGSPVSRVESVGRALQRQGFLISGQDIFGGRPTSGHASGSYHYQGRAIDVNWPNAAQEPAHLRPLYNQLAKGTGPFHPTELFYQSRGIPGPVADHYDHLHLAYKAGGLVGKISPHSPSHPAIGDKWLKGVGSNWDPNEIFTALRQLGAPKDMAKFLSAVSVGESGGNPHAVGHDPGGTRGLGLLQITTGFNDDIINKYGGVSGVMNPWENLLAGMDIYRRQGPGAWYGHLGGRGHALAERITGAKMPKVPGTKKNKKKKPGGGGDGGSDWLDLLMQAGEDRFTAASDLADIQNTRIGSANELIGQGNFEALQRFQVGSAQNPVLGLAKPGMPTPAGMIPSMEPWQFLNQVSASTGSASPSISSVGVNNVTPQGDLAGHALPKKRRRPVAQHTHVYIAGREVRHATKTELRRAARGGHRPLPSRGGGL